MPLWDYVQQSAGFVPYADAEAQKRCAKYIIDTVQQLKDEDSEAPSQSIQNLISMYTSMADLATNNAGSRTSFKANQFWKLWDRNKYRIIELKEQTTDDIDIQNVLEKLEDGRHIPS